MFGWDWMFEWSVVEQSYQKRGVWWKQKGWGNLERLLEFFYSFDFHFNFAEVGFVDCCCLAVELVVQRCSNSLIY